MVGRKSRKKERSPTEALAIARNLLESELFHIGDPQLANELSELGYPRNEAMLEALCAAVAEISRQDYQAPGDPDLNPGFPFIWNSKKFGKRMYFKFKIKGTRNRPVLWVYSCHEAYF